jgi:multiple sugar transport system substrate-binding protein
MKFKSVLLIVMAIVLTISACAPAPTATQAPAATEAPAATKAPVATEAPAPTEAPTATQEPVELVLWAAEPANEFGNFWGDKFEEKYPYIKITTNVMGGDPGNEYFAGVARGDAPDLVAVSLAKFDTYVNAGIVQNITELGEWDDLANFDKGFLDSLRRDGKLYGVPNRSFPMVFGYNKALFAKAGIDTPPTTWEEVLKDAALITKKDEDISGYCMLSKEWTEWWFQYYVWQAGGDLTVKSPDGTIELTFTDPAVITAAKFYQTLLKDKLVQSDRSLDFGSLVSRFAAGKCGMMPFAVDWVNWAVGEGIKREDIGLAIFPAGPSGNRSAAISGSVWIINPAISDSKKAAAMEYIKFYTSHDYMAAFFGEMAGSGAMNPEPMVRTDLSLKDFGLPEEYAAVLAEALVTNRPEEFYGKGDFGKYVDYAIQQIIQDPTMDPAKAFADAQALAISDGAVEKFNAQFKK